MYKLGNNAAYQGLKGAIYQVTRWAFDKNGICMVKLEWVKKQFKQWHPSDNLCHLLIAIFTAIMAVITLLLFKMEHTQLAYLPLGVTFFFAIYLLLRLLAQTTPFTKITSTKAFTFTRNFALFVGNLLLVVAGLALALYSIRITAGDNPMTSDQLSQLNTWINEYFDLIYILAGMLIGAFILLGVQIFTGIRQFKKEDGNRDIGAINKQMSDELNKIRDKENKQRSNDYL